MKEFDGALIRNTTDGYPPPQKSRETVAFSDLRTLWAFTMFAMA
jgi:hypothetical protein